MRAYRQGGPSTLHSPAGVLLKPEEICMRLPRPLRSDLSFSLALGALVGSALVLSGNIAPARAAEATVTAPAPAYDPPAKGRQIAILAGGCFWGVEGVFDHVKGISAVTSGYAGSKVARPGYEQVSTGTTGAAESVRIVFDPSVISYGQILRIFFSVAHDPTQLNRQGPDHGTQYRSAVFPMNGIQAEVARRYIAQLGKAGVYGRPIVTRLEGRTTFYPAEAYHQEFMRKNPGHPYIVQWDAPKVAALKARFGSFYKG